MNIRKKLLTSAGLSVSLAMPIATVIACGKIEEYIPKYVQYNGGAIAKSDSYFVTDGGSIDDKSFNESGYDGFASASGESDASGHVMKPKDASLISDSYNTVKGLGGKLVVAMGFNHVTPLKRFSAENPGMGFVLVDGTLDSKDDKGATKQQGNVTSIVFKTEQAAFLEGVIAAKRAVDMDATDPKIGWWGGMNIPSVNSFINGLKQGVDFYNQNNGTTKDVTVIDAGYVGNFEAGKGKIPAEKLIDKGAELLLGVAGPQAYDAITAIKAKSKSSSQVQIIGVDTDMSQQVKAAEKGYVFDSILKKLKSETEKAVKALIANTSDPNYGFGNVYQASLDDKGVGVTDPSKIADAANKLPNKSVKDIEDAAKLATP